ncbi:putative F-box/LRR-repeat protein 23 [Papaver somniferum]|uniref:putative F-box/LRR-repeat protein 23 n=1 Tax=Papaver somniferum TaxID=3469 RepID=UPI000E704DAF|nr:putative F-box/LRR-repeat protein 23 [Papaver somniferum]
MDNQTLLSSAEEVRNWDELPPDILSHIFLKLGAIDILFNAQSVCSAWPEVSKEPSLFRSIEISLDMQNRWRHAGLFEDRLYQLEKLAKESADRSCGQLVKFSMERFDSDELLACSDSLRCLRLVSCDKVSEDALVNMAKKAVLLEELEICHCSFSADMLKTIGKVWPQLKSFRLNRRGYRFPHRERDDEALAIAENMPQLRRLHLFGNKLTNVGLRAILDGCLHLESLDLRQCFNLNLEGDLLKICGDTPIKIRLPNDSTNLMMQSHTDIMISLRVNTRISLTKLQAIFDSLGI